MVYSHHKYFDQADRVLIVPECVCIKSRVKDRSQTTSEGFWPMYFSFLAAERSDEEAWGAEATLCCEAV